MSKPDEWRATPVKPILNPADPACPAKEHA
jgi:hypothetical protein